MSVYTQGLSPEKIDDLVENTLRSYDKNSWTDISTSLQDYFATSNFLLDDKVGHTGGTRLQWQVKVRNTGAAKVSGLYGVDDVQTKDVMKSVSVPWTKTTTNFGYDIDEEGFQSGDMHKIVDVMQTRRHAAITDWIELQEELFWSMPANTTDAEMMKPLGIPYWIVRNATTGFNGGNPSGHSDVAGLSASVYSNWRNFTGQYTNIAKRDLVKLLRKAVRQCNFKEPVSHPGQSTRPRFSLATTEEVVEGLEEVLEEQNMNLGNDLASKDGMAVLRRFPVKWVPYLDQYSGASTVHGKNPIYGIDRNSFKVKFKTGAWMRRSKPHVGTDSHTTRHVHFDTWMQYQCKNRRCNFVVSQA